MKNKSKQETKRWIYRERESEREREGDSELGIERAKGQKSVTM